MRDIEGYIELAMYSTKRAITDNQVENEIETGMKWGLRISASRLRNASEHYNRDENRLLVFTWFKFVLSL